MITYSLLDLNVLNVCRMYVEKFILSNVKLHRNLNSSHFYDINIV